MSSLRRHFGTAGLLVAIAALVAALGGGAYAANSSGDNATASAKKKNRKGKQGGLNAKQKRQVIALAKRFAGKQGPQGPQGLPGAPGANGLPGAAGKDGANGTNGTNGTNGKSVTVTEVPAEELECDENGGAEVKQEGAAQGIEVCNGAPGEDGEPWTAGGTLPPNATSKGAWALRVEEDGLGATAISFVVPLAAPLGEANVHSIPAAGPIPAACDDGSAPPASVSNPEAESGHLCVFEGMSFGVGAANPLIFHPGDPSAGFGAGRTGAHLVTLGGTPNYNGVGTWAVTG